MQETEEEGVGFVIEELEWQEALYQMGMGEETEKIDEAVRKSVLQGLNKMRDGLQQQREGIVKEEEGLAEIIKGVTNTPIRSLGPLLESLASAKTLFFFTGVHHLQILSSGSVCPPTPVHSTLPIMKSLLTNNQL